MKPSFNENFGEKNTCGSREQYTGPTELDANATEKGNQLYPNVHLIYNFRNKK